MLYIPCEDFKSPLSFSFVTKAPKGIRCIKYLTLKETMPKTQWNSSQAIVSQFDVSLKNYFCWLAKFFLIFIIILLGVNRGRFETNQFWKPTTFLPLPFKRSSTPCSATTFGCIGLFALKRFVVDILSVVKPVSIGPGQRAVTTTPASSNSAASVSENASTNDLVA